MRRLNSSASPAALNLQTENRMHGRGVTIIAVVISACGGFVLGRLSSDFSPQSMQQMDDFLVQMQDLNEDWDAQFRGDTDFQISLLTNLESGRVEDAKEILVDELGHSYYNFTYEGEREMNSETVETVLRELETLAKDLPSFQKVIEYVPQE